MPPLAGPARQRLPLDHRFKPRSSSFCSLVYFRDKEDAEFNLPDLMTAELKAQLDAQGLEKVRSRLPPPALHERRCEPWMSVLACSGGLYAATEVLSLRYWISVVDGCI